MRKLNAIRPLFESYTSIDETVVRSASNHKLYLIGGTAIDMLCRHYGINNNRNRSNNDIDFLSFATNISLTREYVAKLISLYNFKKDIDSEYMVTLKKNDTLGVDVDILIDYENNNLQYGMTVNDVLVMSPAYMVYTKLDRYLSSSNEERRRIDIADVETLLKIMDKIGETEFSSLESIISKSLRANSMIDIINGLVEKLS